MSGICGIYNFCGETVREESLNAMVDVARHLGPDGVRQKIIGHVGFAHLALHTTTESLLGSQPLVCSDGDILITADVRVDNRDDLIKSLNQTNFLKKQAPSDVEIVLAAYKRWGVEHARYIVGDYAYAIWDGRHSQLHCVTDALASKALFYHLNHKRFIFASMPRQLLAFGDVEKKLNEAMIGFWVNMQPDDFYTHNTFFEDIKRTPPSHFITVDAGGRKHCDRYWDVQRNNGSLILSDEEYAHNYKSLLVRSTKAVARSSGPVSVFTSGGLDSTSIICILQRELEQGKDKYKMVSTIFDKHNPSDESGYIQSVAERCGIKPHLVDGGECLAFSRQEFDFELFDEPSWFFNKPSFNAMAFASKGMGCRVILSGQDSDSAFMMQNVIYDELFKRLKIKQLIWELTASKVSKRAISRQLVASLYRLVAPIYVQELKQKMASKIYPFLGEALQLHFSRKAALSHGFKSAVTAQQYKTIFVSALQCRLLLQQRANALGLEMRDPYSNRELVEFMLTLPVEQLMRRGVHKPILRNAMQGVLPESVRLRTDKTGFSYPTMLGFCDWWQHCADQNVSRWQIAQRDYVNVVEFNDHMKAGLNFKASGKRISSLALRLVMLEFWLRRHF